MPAPRIRTQFDTLSQVARKFGAEATRSRQTVSKLKNKIEILRGGDWVGVGADKFYAEMDSTILPSLDRLTKALDKAEQSTARISALMKKAEDECAAIMRRGSGQMADGAGGSGGAAGGADGSSSGGPGGAGSGGPGGTGGAGGAGSGGPGGSGGAGGAGSGGAGSGGPPSWLKGKGKFFEWARQDGKGSGKPAFGFKYGFAKGAVFGDAKAADGVSALGGEIGAELGIEGLKKGKIGIFADGYLAKAQGDTIFAGDKQLGVTGAGEVKVGGAQVFAGYKEGQLGAVAGVSLVTAKGEVGANIAGYNVGVNAEVGIKAELGFKIGPKGVQVKLPFVSLGFSFGGARS